MTRLILNMALNFTICNLEKKYSLNILVQTIHLFMLSLDHVFEQLSVVYWFV
jgi:hypothetical protein